jgi:hypothetical protein
MRLSLIVAMLAMSMGFAQASQLAFVVGISKYANIPQLPNPEVDAQSFKNKLSAAGYKITLLINKEASKTLLLQRWQEFLTSVRPGDDVVIYYSGHGVDVKGANYLVPQDSLSVDQIGGEIGKQSNLISFRDLMQSMEDRAVGMQVWIIDACRSDPFQPASRPMLGSGGLTGDISQNNRFVVFSANYGQVALDRLPTDPPDKALGSPFSRILVSMFDEWKSRSIRDLAGELRKRTIASVDPFPQFPVWEDGLLPIWCFTKCDESDVQKAIAKNEEAARKLAAMSQMIAREKYPLSPNEVYYDVEYPMQQEALKIYTDRIRKGFVDDLRAKRDGRGKTSDSLEDEPFEFILTRDGWDQNASFLPDRRNGKDGFAFVLFEDDTSFNFKDKAGHILTLMCSTPEFAKALVTMPQKEEIVQEIVVFADFKRRVFVKRVWCKNLVRMGDDNLAFSSTDLIGRRLTTDSSTYSVPISRDLKSTFLKFSYDYGFLQRSSFPERAPPGRLIELGGGKEVEVTAAQVGLAGVQLGGAQ